MSSKCQALTVRDVAYIWRDVLLGQSNLIHHRSFDLIIRKVCCQILGSSPAAEASATDQSDDEGERDDVHPEKSQSEGTEAERSERTEEEFFENNGSSSSTSSYSDNESVTSNFDEENPFKWDKVRKTGKLYYLLILVKFFTL